MSGDTPRDSVPLTELAEVANSSAAETPKPTREIAYNFKLMLSLFLMFLLVVSEMFTGSVISSFGEKALIGRTLTVWGVILQGLFLVVGYAVAVYLIKHGIL